MMLNKNRERSERKKRRKFCVLGIKNHRSAAVRGGGAPGAPPLDPLVLVYSTDTRVHFPGKNQYTSPFSRSTFTWCDQTRKSSVGMLVFYH